MTAIIKKLPPASPASDTSNQDLANNIQHLAEIVCLMRVSTQSNRLEQGHITEADFQQFEQEYLKEKNDLLEALNSDLRRLLAQAKRQFKAAIALEKKYD